MKRWIIGVCMAAALWTGSVAGVGDGFMMSASAQVLVQKSTDKVLLRGEKVYLHRVRKGQTVFSIAKAYNVTPEAIYKLNPYAESGIDVNQNLFIPYEATDNQTQELSSRQQGYAAELERSTDKATAARQPQEQEVSARRSTERVETGNGADARMHTSQADAAVGAAEMDNMEEGMILSDSLLASDSIVEIFTGELAPLNPTSLRVALCLPLTGQPVGQRNNENFADFYKGFLLAMNQMKNRGISVDMKVMSSYEPIDTAKLQGANLIIGPVYERNAAEVVAYATKHKVAVVSPLSDFKELQSPYLFQVSPEKERKYDKLLALLTEDPSVNVILLEPTVGVDQELCDFVRQNKISAQRIRYSKDLNVNNIADALVRNGRNIILIPMTQESQVEQVLSRLVSLNATGRYQIQVVGSSVWGKFENLNVDLLFKLSAGYVTSYHADRTSKVIRKFQSDYAEAFGAMPSLFAMRGYDVGVYFVGALAEYGTRMPLEIEAYSPNQMLDVKYRYARKAGQEQGTFVNSEWMQVEFKPDYSVSLK